jgi:hypothetical protein
MGHITAINSNDRHHGRAEISSPMTGRITKGITDPVGLVESIVALEMFGIEYRAVPGFGGRGDTRVAFERGELDVNTQATPAYNARVQPMIDEGKAIPAYAIGFIDADGNPVRDPANPDIITAPELYQQIHGEMPSGPAWEAYKVVANLVQNTRGTIWVHSRRARRKRATRCVRASTRWFRIRVHRDRRSPHGRLRHHLRVRARSDQA